MNIDKNWSSCKIEKFVTLSDVEDQLQKENSHYIRKHPEVRAMVRTLLHAAINRPPTSPAELAASVFDLNTNALLKVKIDEERIYIVKQLKHLNWDKYDAESFLTRESTHSMLSNISVFSDLKPLLRFAIILQRKH